MLTRSGPAKLSDPDYDAIESAVMETARGRWFLAEFARRNRHADTTMLLGAINRLASVTGGGGPAAAPDPRIHGGLMDMAKAIADTKAEIAAIDPRPRGHLDAASEELDLIVLATEKAAADILSSAEQVQEVAWTLREEGLRPDACDALDTQATHIYTACSFQDLAGQRTRKVIDALRFLEGRVASLIEIWGAAAQTSPDAKAPDARQRAPVRDEFGRLNQADVDAMLAPRPPRAAGRAHLRAVATDQGEPDYPPTADPFPGLDMAGWDADADDFGEAISGEVPPAAEAGHPTPQAVAQGAAPAHDPLAPLRALSNAEKVALFS